MKNVKIRRGYEPGLIGRVAELHGRYYDAAWGVGAPFEMMMAREFCDFIEDYDPERDIVLSAYVNGIVIGSISILGGRAGDPDAQLRFFIVDPLCQGRGAGRALLEGALQWCRDRGYRTVFLWTVDGLPRSRRMYDQAGFHVVERWRDDRYSAMLECLKMECQLDSQLLSHTAGKP